MNGNFFDKLISEFQLPLDNPVLIFSLILFIILLSPLILKKLKIPGIIGLIVSGVIIGPNALNLLAKNSAVNLFSTIGLLYIMFIAGLELDLTEFKKTKNRSIIFGFFTFILPMGIGFPVCHFLLGYSLSASMLISSMFATHTLVAYPIISKFGISKNDAVAIVVGGTILTDTAVLLILAIIIGSINGGLTKEFWIGLGTSLAFFLAFMFFVIPRIAKWFFSKVESEKTSHYIFVLSVVFFSAFLSQVAGVEPIIGAFVAGLALNKLVPHSSVLMNRIEFIGNAIFIPFFLISVGMIVDLRVVFNGPIALVVAASLTVVAVTGKWLAAFITQLLFKFSGSQRQLIFGLSSAHAAATLAVILVGYNYKIIDENVLNGTIILILVTCIIASFATENASRKIVQSSDLSEFQDKAENGSTGDNILLPIADMANFENLLNLAVMIKNSKSNSPITVLTVVQNNEEAEHNVQKARRNLGNTVKLASASETKINVIATIDYNIASGIARTSKEMHSDIILMGWPKRTSILEKIFGEKIINVVDNTDKNIFICSVKKPFVSVDKIVIICPPSSELEHGFGACLNKFTKLSKELSIGITFFCNSRSIKAIVYFMEKHKLLTNHSFEEFDDWDNFFVISDSISENNLIVLINARQGSVSYQSHLDNISEKIQKHFLENNKIMVYPQRHDSGIKFDEYNEITSEPIQKGLETIQKIRLGLSNLIKK